MNRRNRDPAGDAPEALLLRLRARIAAQRAAAAPGAAAAGPAAEDLERAARLADVGSALPLFSHLGPLRRAVARLAGRAVLYLLRLVTVDQSQFNRALVRAAAALDRDAAAQHTRMDELATRQPEQVAALEDRLQAVDAELGGRLRAIDAGELGGRLQSIEAGLGERDRWFAELSERAAGQQRALAELQSAASGLGERDRWFADLANRDTGHERAIGDLRAAVAYLRAQIADRDRRIDALLAEVSARPLAAGGAAPMPLPPAPASEAAALDAWAFGQAFHGDEAAVREHQQRYVRYFAGGADVLDIGCGRGEFLELLRDAGVAARGIDLSNDMVLRCREKRLDVVKAEALAYLAAVPDASLGGIFAGQVIEHLPTPAVPAFVQLAYQKLRPDGVLGVETLNPECLLVHYRWFWMDLTHVRLVHPETLKFLLVTTGFRDLEGLFIPPREEAPLLPPLALPGGDPAALARFNAATDHLNRLLHGSPDYALIARR